MARPRRFKKVSVSFPIDLYLKVDAAVNAAAPHGMSSWIAEACRAKLPSIMTGPERQGTHELAPISPEADRLMVQNAAFVADLKFHREAFALVVPRLTDAEALAVTDAVADKAAASAIEKPEAPKVFFDKFVETDAYVETDNPELKCKLEFGPQVLAAAARSVPSWGKWDWKQRLEHLRELKAAAVSG